MRVTLAITSHERPDALDAVLRTVAAQRTAPAEIIIADDGSGPETRRVIEDFIARSATSARLVWQPHEGFRVGRLRNLAIAAATGDYLVFIDGDMLLHPEFMADHLRFARPGWYTQGVRVHADGKLTRELLARPGALPAPLAPGLGFLRRLYLLRSPGMAGVTRRIGSGLVAVKACNQGAWRSDLLRINGFDETMVGWGPEDKELCARLEHAGVRRQTLLFGGIAWHLHHPAASRAALPANLARLAATRSDRRVRCDHGVSAHMRP